MPPPTVWVNQQMTHIWARAYLRGWSRTGVDGGMRSTIAASFLLALLVGMGTAAAAECPPGALGVSRTIVVDPSEHVRLGCRPTPAASSTRSPPNA